jgi:hypothetical protein
LLDTGREACRVVVIGIYPHQRTHAASALEPGTHVVVGTLQIEALLAGYRQLLRWAGSFGQRRWAVENARGLGSHLAQCLVARGERVGDVTATATAGPRTFPRWPAQDRRDRRGRSSERGSARR